MVRKRKAGHKKIDEWEFLVNGVRAKVEVDMVKREGSTTFKVETHWFGGFQLWDDDIDKLRRQVEAELKSRSSIKWERMLHVRLTGFHASLEEINPASVFGHREDTGKAFPEGVGDTYHVGENRANELHVEVTAVLVGTDYEGKKVHRGGYGYDNRIASGWPEESEDFKDTWGWHRNHHENNRGVAALVPDTPENRKALNQLFEQMQALKQHLAKLMRPDQLQLTLARTVGNVLALPAPSGEEPKKVSKPGRRR